MLGCYDLEGDVDAVSGIEKFEYNVTVKKEDETVQITSDGQQQFYLLSGRPKRKTSVNLLVHSSQFRRRDDPDELSIPRERHEQD